MSTKLYLCIMARIKFFIQTSNNPAGIYARLIEGRIIDAKAKTKLIVNINDWSVKKGSPIRMNTPNLKKLDNDLMELRLKILNHYNDCVSKETINSQWLKDFLNPIADIEAAPNSLITYFDFYVKHQKSNISPSTLKKYVVIINLVKRFQNDLKREIFIKDVNADFKLKFQTYCLGENYGINTISRALKFIKSVCYHARANGIEVHPQLTSIKILTNKTDKIFLSVEEIELIANVKLEQEHLINARDWLVISCETGQRVSDFMKFTKSKIRNEVSEKSGKKIALIEFTQVKTQKLMAIPLQKKVIEILNKRNGEFPREISDQKYNEYIKVVCDKAGINQIIKGSKMKASEKKSETGRKESGEFPKFELVTSHIGRRSFATNYYGIIPTSLLMNATGHTTEKMFLEYIGKTETDMAKQLAEYFI
jgi:integrase